MLRIAPDTNLLRATAARRFLCALVEQQGGRIVVLPTAREEGSKQIGLAAREDVIRLLRVRPARDPAQATRAIMAAEAGARQWWLEEERRNDSPFEFVDPERNEADRYLARQTVLSPECHRDRGEAVNDLALIGEALEWDVTLLATNNFTSLDIEEVNRCVIEAGVCDRAMVYRPDEAVTEAVRKGKGEDTTAQAAARAALAASISARPRPAAADAGSVVTLAEHLRGCGFEATGRRLRTWIEHTHDRWEEIMSQARLNLAKDEARQAREAQDRHLHRVRSAVRDTGYNPWC